MGSSSAASERTNDQDALERLADVLIVVLLLFAALSVIGGIALGVQLSEETEGTFSDETTRDGAVLAAWIAVGFASAVVYLVAMAVLGLLRSILRELRMAGRR
jgi:uncharacterized RDD family membrane protein YckC